MRLLGAVEVAAESGLLAIPQPLARALAVRLALARGVAVADDILIRDLWGDADTARPTARLRVLASRLRGALGHEGDALRRTPAGFCLDAVPIDLNVVEDAVAAIDVSLRAGDLTAVFETADTALSLWRGEALADLRDVPFVALEQQRLESLRLELELGRGEAGLALGKDVGADLERLVSAHPLNERLIGVSAQALAGRGLRAEAAARLEQLRITLAEELGIDPGPETLALEARLRAQPDRIVRSILPPRAKTFIGRRDEQASLLEQVSRPCVVTLRGGPGVGKTRLAREVAESAQRLGRTVGWLDLAPLQVGDNLSSALAAAVGVDGGSTSSLSQSIEALRGTLLVIDNAEHLVEETAALVEELRSATPGLTMLVTSQRALRISDEQVHRIGPLPAQAATELFCARSGLPSSVQIDAICAAVDRLPLAIELAAGLTRILSVEQLAERIDDRLRLLIRGLRDSGARHSSLRAALDWSHELLTPQARIALRRLSVFANGCTLTAAEQVVAGDDLVAAGEIDGLLTDLVDRSLLTVDDTGRFRQLQSIREYGLEQLRDADEEQPVRGRHVAWCIQVAAHAEQYGRLNRIEGMQRDLVRGLNLEEPNLLGAVDWCLTGGEPALASRIVAPLAWYWAYRGLVADAIEWLRASLAAVPRESVRYAASTNALAVLTRMRGRYAEALELGQEALRMFRQAGDDRGTITALQGVTLTSIGLDDIYLALTCAHEVEVRTRTVDLAVMRGASLNCMGLALRMMGYSRDAKKRFEEALECWIGIQHGHGYAVAMCNLGVMAHQAGEYAHARELCLRALAVAHEIGFAAGQIDCLETLARVETATGRLEQAAELIAATNHQRQLIAEPITVADAIADQVAATEYLQAKLGPRYDEIAGPARQLSLDAVVDKALS